MKTLTSKINSDLHVRVTSEFSGRVDTLVSAYGSANSIAKKCGVSEGVIRKWRKGESEPTLSNLIALAEAGGVNLLWLATGKGPKEPTPPQPEPPSEVVSRILALYMDFPGKVGSSQLNRSAFVQFWNNRSHRFMKEPSADELPPDLVALIPTIDEDQLVRWENAYRDYQRFEKEQASREAFDSKHKLSDSSPASYSSKVQDGLDLTKFALVPRFDVEASAGGGALVGASEGVVDRLAFRRDWLAERGLEAAKLTSITVRGDSMEPTIPAGALVLLDLREVLLNKVGGDGIFAIQMDEHLSVKRLQRHPDGSVVVISDNRIYKEWEIPVNRLDALHIIGRVVWIGYDLK